MHVCNCQDCNNSRECSTARIVGMTPSDEFEPPALDLDAPPGQLNFEQKESLRRIAGFAEGSDADINLRIVVETIVKRHKADAWDEGNLHGRDNSLDGFCLCTAPDWSETNQCVNPYRTNVTP